VPRLAAQVDQTRQWYSEEIQRHRLYVSENGEDLPEIQNWQWQPDKTQ
jgi:xylulose-5-phosphate/fructose-6-phosphate phosphoketolase